MIKHRYHGSTGFCFLEAIAMVTGIPLAEIVDVAVNRPEYYMAIGHPKEQIIGGAIRDFAPWLKPMFDACMQGRMVEPENETAIPNSGRGLAMVWHPTIKGKHPNGVLLGTHVVAFDGGKIHDSERETEVSLEEYNGWLKESGWKVVSVSVQPVMTML